MIIEVKNGNFSYDGKIKILEDKINNAIKKQGNKFFMQGHINR